ncbi:primosomal protein DnaI [Niallia sp. Krafla_26]|uniref:primosomal protein DnaI n=1 Tax=Niallia sp. Krafla_26 TaxID=3064703 RepID=UPI003D1851AE
MERINETLKRFAGNEGFQKRYQEMREAILNHPEIQAFLMEHQEDLSSDVIEKNLSKLYEFTNQSKECDKCSSLDGCINMMQGYHPQLVFSRGSIEVHYDKCPRKVMDDEKRKNEKLIQSLYVPKDILRASFATMDQDGERMDAIQKAVEFVLKYREGQLTKGLYFYGQFGVGKSYILGAIANELAKNKISSMIVYVPELFRELKGSIGDSTLNEKLDAIKKEPILMLDDIGAESMSSWVRDEILGPILQYRMLDNLPTFFTSNMDFAMLEHHLTYSQRGEEEKIKARRIMERIKYLAEPVKVTGINRRN